MKLAIFDFDRTLFPDDTIPYLMKQWYKLNYSKSKIAKVYARLLPFYMAYKLKIGGIKANKRLRKVAIEGFHDLFKGMTRGEVEEFFLKVSSNLNQSLNKNVVAKVLEARKAGMHTVIISGAYEPLLLLVGDFLNFDTIIGTKLEFDESGVYIHNQKFDIIEGDKKAEELTRYFTKGIDWKNSTFYTDSVRDLKLLQLVGNPVAVNPDQELLSHATKLKWEILQ